MARQIPFRFSRYRISVDDEVLGAAGQTQAFTEIQGEEYEHGSGRRGLPAPHVLIMEPKLAQCDGKRCLTFSIGRRAGVRTVQDYNQTTEQVSYRLETDTHIKLARVVAVPSMGLMAIEDRSSDTTIGADQAVRSLRTVVGELGDVSGVLDVIHLDDADVASALQQWDLTRYDYTVSPLNPISAGDLAERRSAAMKQENIGVERGVALPKENGVMRENEGLIAETAALADVGYGQNGFRGVTPDGHEGHIPKPKFHRERQKNLSERDKPRFLRMYFDTEDGNLWISVARALMRFYQHVE